MESGITSKDHLDDMSTEDLADLLEVVLHVALWNLLVWLGRPTNPPLLLLLLLLLDCFGLT